jgi:WD40 repeat protein
LHLWNASSNFARPNLSIEAAHAKAVDTGSIVFSVDGRTLMTRAGDDTVKRERELLCYGQNSEHQTVWDLRAFKKPLASRSELSFLYTNTNAVFSPDDKYVVTGASSATKGGSGRLVFMQKDNLEIVQDLSIQSTPVKVLWHSKINQVRSCA